MGLGGIMAGRIGVPMRNQISLKRKVRAAAWLAEYELLPVLSRSLLAAMTVGWLGALGAVARAAPIEVKDQKQLFFDQRFIENADHVTITMNPPRKLGPVLKPDRRWEDFRITSYFTVVQDGGVCRMYYSCFSEDQWNFASSEVTWRDYAFLCLAESTDGIHWTKPNLGIIEYNGSRSNNIIARSIVDGTVFIDPTAEPAKRYKMLSTIGAHSGGLRVSYSADGIHFTMPEQAVSSWRPDSQQNAFYDQRLGTYVAYLRGRNGMGIPLPDRRCVVRVEVKDIAAPWNQVTPQLVLAPDSEDSPEVDFYTNAGLKYPYAQDAYFFFPAAYHHFPKQFGNDGLLDCSIAASRDGIHWQRPDRRPYVGLGEKGDWDAAFIMMGVGLVRQGDRLIQYYNGTDISHGGTRKASKQIGSAQGRRRWGWMGAVEQRLDGFFSADTDYRGGSLSTPLIVFSGNRLELNLNTSAIGEARVEIQDEQGRPIPGFALQDCDAIMANDVRYVTAWKGNSNVSALTGRPVRLHFEARATRLYAFQFTK